MNEKSEFSKLENRVKDGTKCKLGSRDACIAGVCKVSVIQPCLVCINILLQKVGCDYVIDSEVEEDACGVCGGTGKSCTVMTFNITDVGKGKFIYFFSFATLIKVWLEVRLVMKDVESVTRFATDTYQMLCR